MGIETPSTNSIAGVVTTVLGWLAFGIIVCLGWQIGLKLWGAF